MTMNWATQMTARANHLRVSAVIVPPAVSDPFCERSQFTRRSGRRRDRLWRAGHLRNGQRVDSVKDRRFTL